MEMMEQIHGLGHLLACVFLFDLTTFMAVPAITDVSMEVMCPGQDECSLAVYLSGLGHLFIGLTSLVVSPVVGNLSDRWGRKALMTVPATLAIAPLAILAYSRSAAFFYGYFIAKMLTGVFDGSMRGLSLAYAADVVGERRRTAAFGFVSGAFGAGLVAGTLLARILPTSITFQAATVVAVFTLLYVRLFLPDSRPSATECGSKEPLVPFPAAGDDYVDPPHLAAVGKLNSISDALAFLTSRLTMSRAAVVIFLYSLGEGGLRSALLFYLKAKFHFNKDQFAILILISGLGGALSQLTLMPLLASRVGEEVLLNIGLLGNFANVLLLSVAWSRWVPYYASAFVLLSGLVYPCVRSMVSKQVGSNEQGMAQGLLNGVNSLADIISPLAFTPLTAMFLSETPPFNFKGFSLLCSAVCTLTAFAASILMRRSRSSVATLTV